MNVTDILLDIVVVLLAAKLAAEIAERIGIPAVIGEILAGIVIGPAVFGLIDSNAVIEVLGELGVILLLLEVGLELSVKELRSVGRSSLTIAVIGVVVPVALGIGVGLAFGETSNTALFLGTALAATSVGITARVFSDLGALTRTEARAVLGAAVADDVLGLVLLTIVVRIVTLGSIDVVDVVQIVVVALAFLVVAVVLGSRLGPRLFRFIDDHAVSAGTFVALALAFTLAFASLADAAKLAPIVGAFAAGVALSGSSSAPRIRRELAPVGHLFIPVFFLQIGIHADLGGLGEPRVLALIACLVVVASIGKLVAGLGLLGGIGDRLMVGLGMLPRGEVGLIFASIGLAQGVLSPQLYAALVAVVLLTTLVAPPLLRIRIRALDRRRPVVASVPEPTGGWLRVGDTVDLVAEPGTDEALVVALDAARLVHRAPPSETLLDWLGRVDLGASAWDRRATNRLLDLLRNGSERSWRFLDVADVLERALPEVAEVVRRRRRDPFVLDPAQILRFEHVEEMRRIVAEDPLAATVAERLRYPEQPMLAALVLSVTGAGNPVDLARRLAERLRIGFKAEAALIDLIEDRNLMRSAAHRIDGLDEEPVLALATHLETPERARALYLLSLALGDLERVERGRLDQLVGDVLRVLGRTDLTGRGARSVLEERRTAAVALTVSRLQAEMVRRAPRAYVLGHSAEALARHASLFDPALRRGEVRILVDELADDRGLVEVASFDKPGLLAAVTALLAARGGEIVRASAATWPDGSALESFELRTVGRFLDFVDDPHELESAIAESLRTAPAADPAPDLDVTFDDDTSPWHTVCEVSGPDRPGLVHTVTTAFWLSGVSVHSAEIDTVDGRARDRFEVTRTNGAKLDADTRRAVREAIASGPPPAATRLGPVGAVRRRLQAGAR